MAGFALTLEDEDFDRNRIQRKVASELPRAADRRRRICLIEL
jgi:hypothetical protein